MRVALEQLDTRGIVLELPPGADGIAQSVTLRSAQKLRGTLEHGPEGLSISGLAAEEILCAAVGLAFGQVRLSEGELAGHGIFAELSVAGHHVTLDAGAATLGAGSSAVDVGTFHVEGQVRLGELRLQVRDTAGQLEFGEIEVRGFAMRDRAVSALAESVVARGLRISWGNGLRLEVESLEARDVRFTAGPAKLEVQRFTARDGLWHAGRATVGAVSLSQAKLIGELSTSAPSADWEALLHSPRADRYLKILDSLSGHVDVDVEVDLKIPVLGSRHAVHEMRIPIQDGSFDFMRLEGNLAKLENALLDFAVRDGALGLEVGIPLLPTRGRGKQIIVWDLNESDLALATQNRVRLAVLPKARLAVDLPQKDANEDDEGKASFGLRHLGLSNVDVLLRLAHEASDPASVLRWLRLAELHLRGNVHHDAEGAQQRGELAGELVGLEARLSELPIGDDRLSVESFQVERLADVHVAFLGPLPAQVKAELRGLTLAQLTFVTQMRVPAGPGRQRS
jgi:hypothetical protein